MSDGEGPAESRGWWICSRRHCVFIMLVLVALLFFYNVDIKDMAPDWGPNWWTSANETKTKWWIPFKRPSGNGVPHELVAGGDRASAGTNGSSTTAEGNETASNSTSRTTATWTVGREVAAGPVPVPVPYVSPGPYVVEYPYSYHFIINEPNGCEDQKPFVVLMVPVAPHNRAHRDIIRSTWGSERAALGKVVSLFFLLGQHAGGPPEELEEQLQQESREHRDLIQSNFLDCYKNLTIKTMVMLEWLDAYCPGAAFAMKIDSDMFLNVPKLVGMLSQAPRTEYMTGLVARGARVLRDRHSKWYLPESLYARPEYPRYALGLGYVLSLDLPKKLVEASRHVTPLYIEDVYLGLCMEFLHIPPTDPPSWSYFQVSPVTYSRCSFANLIATTTDDRTDRLGIWRDFKRPGPYC